MKKRWAFGVVLAAGCLLNAGCGIEIGPAGSEDRNDSRPPAATEHTTIKDPSAVPPMTPFPPAISQLPFAIPSPAPGLPPAGAIPSNRRCGASGIALLIDGERAFYFYDDAQRADALTQLIASGYCATTSRLGANINGITIDGPQAVWETDDSARLAELIELHKAGLGQENTARCSANCLSILIDGKAAFEFTRSKDLVDRLAALAQSGACH